MFFHKRFEKPSDNELGAWEEPIPKKTRGKKSHWTDPMIKHKRT